MKVLIYGSSRIPITDEEICRRAKYLRDQLEINPSQEEFYLPDFFETMSSSIFEIYQMNSVSILQQPNESNYRYRKRIFPLIQKLESLEEEERLWLLQLCHFIDDQVFFKLMVEPSVSKPLVLLPSKSLAEEPPYFYSFEFISNFYQYSTWESIPSEIQENQDFRLFWLACRTETIVFESEQSQKFLDSKMTFSSRNPKTEIDPFFWRHHFFKSIPMVTAKFIWSILWSTPDEIPFYLVRAWMGVKGYLPPRSWSRIKKVYARAYRHDLPSDLVSSKRQPYNFSRIVFEDSSELIIYPWLWKKGLIEIDFLDSSKDLFKIRTPNYEIMIINGKVTEVYSLEETKDFYLTPEEFKITFEKPNVVGRETSLYYNKQFQTLDFMHSFIWIRNDTSGLHLCGREFYYKSKWLGNKFHRLIVDFRLISHFLKNEFRLPSAFSFEFNLEKDIDDNYDKDIGHLPYTIKYQIKNGDGIKTRMMSKLLFGSFFPFAY